jgi:hypothetical protein
MKFVWKELQIILSGELEAAQRLCQHLKTQEEMIRRNRSKELVASMREAEELAQVLNHYEIQRARWSEAHSEQMQEIGRERDQRDDFREQFLAIGAALKNVLRDVHDRTIINAELVARMVKRGQELLQEILKAKGLNQQYGARDKDEAPSLFLDQRI